MPFKEAIANGIIRLHFQPIIDLSSNRCVGYEALSRWVEGGEVYGPPSFLPGILGSELERALVDRQMIELNEARQWLDAHGQGDAFVAYNLSLSSLLWKDLQEILAQWDDSPDRLWLEVPEGYSVEKGDVELHQLKALSLAGYKIESDDFGVAWANFSRFLSDIYDGIKIDRSITQGCSRDKRKRALIRAIVAISDEMGMTTIAEGIDNADDAQCCTFLNVQMGQGWLFGKAKPLQ